jgi:hypothetical protein
MTTSSQASSPHSFFTRFPWHLASIALRRTFEHWTKVGAGLQLLRQKADQIGTRNAFNELRDQHRLGDTHLRKEVASRLLKVMDNLKAVESWRATLTEKQRLEWASPDTIIRRCPVFNRPKTATAEAKPSPYAKLEQQHAAALERLHKLEKLEGFLKQDIDVDGDIFLLDAKDKVEVIASKVIEKSASTKR